MDGIPGAAAEISERRANLEIGQVARCNVDIHDATRRVQTLPYRDVAVTDKAMASQIHRTGLSERLQGVALVQLSEMDQHN
jgi:hypothetical protein